MDASEGCSGRKPDQKHARGRLYSDAACVGLPTAYDKRKRPRGVGTSFAMRGRWSDVQLLPRPVGAGPVRAAVNEAVHSPKPRTYCGALASIQRAKSDEGSFGSGFPPRALSHRDSLRSQRARIREAQRMPQGILCVHAHPHTPTHPQALQKSQPSLRITV